MLACNPHALKPYCYDWIGFVTSNVAAARKVFLYWSQKTISHNCLSYFPIVSLCYNNLSLGIKKFLEKDDIQLPHLKV